MHANSAKGVVNVLAIAAATEITLEEAKPVEALLAADCGLTEARRDVSPDTEYTHGHWTTTWG